MIRRTVIPVCFLVFFPTWAPEARSQTNHGVWETIFSSGFEAEEGNLRSDSTWSNTQIQQPTGTPTAFITFDSTIVHSGTRSLKMFAPQRQFDSLRVEDFCGKASVQKTNFLFKEGETYRYSAWFYLTDPPDAARFLMIDIECGESECGFEGGPGFRVMIKKQTRRLIAEWKFLNWFNDLIRPDPPPGEPVPGIHDLPVEEWFKVTLEATLGVGDAGVTRIYFNDELDSEVIGTNIRPGGVLSTMDRYNSLEVGLTCNIGSQPTTIYLDDVTVEKLDTLATSVDGDAGALPEEFQLLQNYPNPFNPETTIRYTLPRPGHVRLTVFNLAGQVVSELAEGYAAAGQHAVVWDGRDDRGRRMASGVYFYKLTTDTQNVTRKMVLLQ